MYNTYVPIDLHFNCFGFGIWSRGLELGQGLDNFNFDFASFVMKWSPALALKFWTWAYQFRDLWLLDPDVNTAPVHTFTNICQTECCKNLSFGLKFWSYSYLLDKVLTLMRKWGTPHALFSFSGPTHKKGEGQEGRSSVGSKSGEGLWTMNLRHLARCE